MTKPKPQIILKSQLNTNSKIINMITSYKNAKHLKRNCPNILAYKITTERDQETTPDRIIMHNFSCAQSNTKKRLQLPVGTTPATTSTENPDDFAYLCVDGSKVPVREKACSWAARPWQGLLGHQDVLAKISPLREKIKQLAVVGKFTLLGQVLSLRIFSLKKQKK